MTYRQVRGRASSLSPKSRPKIPLPAQSALGLPRNLLTTAHTVRKMHKFLNGRCVPYDGQDGAAIGCSVSASIFSHRAIRKSFRKDKKIGEIKWFNVRSLNLSGKACKLHSWCTRRCPINAYSAHPRPQMKSRLFSVPFLMSHSAAGLHAGVCMSLCSSGVGSQAQPCLSYEGR